MRIASARPTHAERNFLVEDIPVRLPLTHDEEPEELVLEGEEVLEEAHELVRGPAVLLLRVAEILLEELQSRVPVYRDDRHVERESRRLDEHLPVVDPVVDGAAVLLGAVARLVLHAEVDDAGQEDVGARPRPHAAPEIRGFAEVLEVLRRKPYVLGHRHDRHLRALAELLAEVAPELRVEVEILVARSVLLVGELRRDEKRRERDALAPRDGELRTERKPELDLSRPARAGGSEKQDDGERRGQAARRGTSH